MRSKVDFLMVGVGGQGTILSSDILAQVGMEAGYDTKKSEVHGMAQRGGSVETHVRWGDKVYSPMVETGRVDYLLGFEMLEAARWWHFLGPHTVSLINRYRVNPPAVNLGRARYPGPEDLEALVRTNGAKVWWIDATCLAVELGNQALSGVIVLGALSTRLEIPEDLWLDVISRRVPQKFVELNKKAFCCGREVPFPFS